MIIHIEITREDLDNGIRGDSEHCPLALACKREFSKLTDKIGDIVDVEVDGNIKISTTSGDLINLNDDRIALFIKRFDREDYPPFREIDLRFEWDRDNWNYDYD